MLGRNHSTAKCFGVLIVSIGICIYTNASSKVVNEMEDNYGSFMEWVLGIAVLSTSLILGARMGVYQEMIHSKWGRHPKEALFYTVIKVNFTWTTGRAHTGFRGIYWAKCVSRFRFFL